MRRFPFRVVYILPEQSSETVLVIAVAHCQRRPSYWQHRS